VRTAGQTDQTIGRAPLLTARRVFVLSSFAVLLAATATTVSATGAHGQMCNCNPDLVDVELVEWNLPMQFDDRAGAITVDVHSSHTGRLWFVTRLGEPRLYRLEPGKAVAYTNAKTKSWNLDPAVIGGGLQRIKVSKDDRYAFVRTAFALQRVQTEGCSKVMLVESCERIVWLDKVEFDTTSDVAVEGCYVYTTAADPGAEGLVDPNLGYVQQLNSCDTPGDAGTTTVKRWVVGGGTGLCPLDNPDTQPCLSGVVTDPKNPDLVYFSQSVANRIGQLNVKTNKVTFWSLTTAFGKNAAGQPNVLEPRQLEFDDDGTIWTVTGSGHLVRLDPKKDRMSRHQMPSGLEAQPWGVAPDNGTIGYTNSNSVNAPENSKVAMLIPRGQFKPAPRYTVTIYPDPAPVDFFKAQTAPVNDAATPQKQTVHGRVHRNNDGVFVEAHVAEGHDSISPLGITPDMSKRVGTFFYAVGQPGTVGFNRVGMALIPSKFERHRHGRDEDDHDRDGKRDDQDDDDDNDGKKDNDDDDDDNDCVKDYDDWDDDNDNIDDKDDKKDRKETRYTRDEEAVAASQSADYPMTVGSENLLLIATATAADPSALLSLEIYNPAGQLVGSPLPSPGVAVATVPTLSAGTYTVRVKNLGLTPTAMSTSLLTQATWPLEAVLP
jgi:hypothetical protein